MISRAGWRHHALGGLMVLLGTTAAAQPATKTTTTTTTAATSQIEPMTAMETLVAPFALYPDDLVALVIPAATNPLQVVDAARYLEKRKADPKLPIPVSWDDSVKSLVNYPDVIRMMNTDLEWTQALDEAIVGNQAAVLDAVQSYRRKVMAAGNLKTDQKQVVTVTEEVVAIAPANPQVIYVPQYQPATMVVYGGYSSWGYWGGYPSYYYPYPPGAALATGLIWGAAIGAAWGGHHYGYWGGGNTIDNDYNFNGNRPGDGNNRPGNGANRPANGGGTAWKPSDKAGATAGNRIGDAGRATAGTMDRAGGYGPAADQARGGASAGSMDRSAGNRASAGTYGPPASGNRGASSAMTSAASRDRSSYGGSSFGNNYSGSSNAFGGGGYGSRNTASAYSNRGAASRGMARSGGRRR